MARKHYRLHVTIPSYEGEIFSGDTEEEALNVAGECYFQSDAPFLVEGHVLTLKEMIDCKYPHNCKVDVGESETCEPME
jgi:hypothetical protein